MNNLMDLGGGVGWFGTLLIGALAGWIAEKGRPGIRTISFFRLPDSGW